MTFPFEIPDDLKYDLVRKLLTYTTNLEKKSRYFLLRIIAVSGRIIPVFLRIMPAWISELPEGSILKEVTYYDVQELSFSVFVTRYELEHWLTPDGTYISGRLQRIFRVITLIQNLPGLAALRASVVRIFRPCCIVHEKSLS
ncbi:hypothetical protein [Endozoicomonas sp. SCSIO W0465]|uniref:hypothetical protein n=1 Tax=Endozoicomonas sp. SCSIO W0465 TaxID=2918516 RepID=UPI00207520A7|nr:hypothetical protein [Endozoicomonas sp. SCSIO W0465]USE36518.1 hypothetical protein MJO57_31660 [Endozoicomonas sp. SCSIO W0465]